MKKKSETVKTEAIDYKAKMKAVIDILYWDVDRDFFNKDKEWNSETIERVAEVVRSTFNFKPEEDGDFVDIEQLPADQPQINVAAYVGGGLIQGARANVSGVGFEAFDADNKKAEGMDSDDIEAEWDSITAQYPYPIY